jgi:GDP-L-fucose synthase
MSTDKKYSLAGKRVWVAGHGGMVGSALLRALDQYGGCEVITAPRPGVDLRRQDEVENFMRKEKPQAVFLAAAKVGGILANSTFPADFIYDNLAIELNVINSAHEIGVEKLLFLGSSCIYPKLAEQPLREESLLTGPLEPTNEWYAVAKISGIKLCQAYRQQYGNRFISAMPTNLYGPNDNFDLQSSHVLPALIRKMHECKITKSSEVVLWGTGTPLREFMHVDDLASALVFLMEHYDDYPHINVGVGSDLSIREIAELVAKVVGYTGELVQDLSKPDGTPRKLMDSSRLLRLGWKPTIDLHSGIANTYEWFLENVAASAKL